MSLTAAADESMRDKRYILGAALYEGACTPAVDALVKSHLLPSQRRFHTKDESDARRQKFLTACASCGLVRAWIYVAPFPTVTARDTCLTELVTDAAKTDAHKIVLDQVDSSISQRDRRTVHAALRANQAEIAFSHEAAHRYGGLQMADAFAWAYGAGGKWRKMIDEILDVERILGP